jgi:hypothetical protein
MNNLASFSINLTTSAWATLTGHPDGRYTVTIAEWADYGMKQRVISNRFYPRQSLALAAIARIARKHGK